MKALCKKGGFKFENYGKSIVKIKEAYKNFDKWVLLIESTDIKYTKEIQLEETKTGYRDYKTNIVLYEAILAE
jgi:hypothetical protein